MAMADEVAWGLGAAQRARMTAHFRQGCRLEFCFWDAAFHQQQWPV